MSRSLTTNRKCRRNFGTIDVKTICTKFNKAVYKMDTTFVDSLLKTQMQTSQECFFLKRI